MLRLPRASKLTINSGGIKTSISPPIANPKRIAHQVNFRYCQKVLNSGDNRVLPNKRRVRWVMKVMKITAPITNSGSRYQGWRWWQQACVSSILLNYVGFVNLKNFQVQNPFLRGLTGVETNFKKIRQSKSYLPYPLNPLQLINDQRRVAGTGNLNFQNLCHQSSLSRNHHFTLT